MIYIIYTARRNYDTYYLNIKMNILMFSQVVVAILTFSQVVVAIPVGPVLGPLKIVLL